MRRTAMSLLAFVTLAAFTAACGAGGNDSGPRVLVPQHEDDLLYLGTQSSLTAVAPGTGAIRFAARGALPTRDWSTLYRADAHEGTTLLHTLDARTGATISTRELPGALQVRTVSDDGTVVALMPVQPGAADAYRSVPKVTTELVVVRRGVDEPQYLTVAANIEPEAFSLSSETLFVIEYLPAEAPSSYRVAALDLASGTVGEVRSSTDEIQEPMSGSARARVLAPDGRRLYTLYTRDAAEAHHAASFVHVLDLDTELASCIDLPAQFAADVRASLAVSPSGTRLYAVSPLGPTVAELDPAELEIGRVTTLPRPDLQGAPTVRATVTDADTLHVAFGAEVVVIDVATLTLTEDAWTAPGVVTGLTPSNDRGRLYVSLADGILAVDARTGVADERYTVPTEGPIDHVAPALRPIVPEPEVNCAC